MKRVRWSPTATKDLEDIYNYLQEHHPSLAHSTIRTLYNAVRSLKQFHNRGRIGRLEGTRELPVVPLPYIIVYGLTDERMRIFRLIHASREWPPKSVN